MDNLALYTRNVPYPRQHLWYNTDMQTERNGFKRNEDGTFTTGTGPGPGRPVVTDQERLVKKAVKQIIAEYKDALADVLPALSPILKEKALSGDMVAIKEVHDQVLGKAKETHRLEGELTVMGVDVAVRK